MSSRENLEITNSTSLFHHHHHHQDGSMMPVKQQQQQQRSKRKLRKRRVIISIFLLLPALAAIIGIVAWAISVEVAKSNEINGFSAGTNHHRKLQQQQQQQSSFQLFKKNRLVAPEPQQPVAAAVVASGNTDKQVDETTANDSHKEQHVSKQQQQVSSSRRRILASQQQQQQQQASKSSESEQGSSTLLLTNIDQVDALTSGLTGKGKQPPSTEEEEPDTTSIVAASEKKLTGSINSSASNNDNPIKQKFESKQKQLNSAKASTLIKGVELEEDEDGESRKNNEQQISSGKQRYNKSKLNGNSRKPSSEDHNDEEQQQASKTQIGSVESNLKQEYMLKQNQALTKKQRFIKPEGKLDALTPRRAEGAQYTIIINNNKQQAPVELDGAKESSSSEQITTQDHSSPAPNVGNTDNNNDNNNKDHHSGNSEEETTADSGESNSQSSSAAGKQQDEEGEQKQDELNFEAIASAISSSLSSQPSSSSAVSLPGAPLEGDTGSLDGSSESGEQEELSGSGQSSVANLDEPQVSRLTRRRSTGQNVAEVIDHIVEHRKSQAGISANLKGPQIVVVAPVMGSMMKAHSLTRVSENFEENSSSGASKVKKQQPEVSEDKRISSSMKKDAMILAQERKWLAKQQQQVSSLTVSTAESPVLKDTGSAGSVSMGAKLAKRLRVKPLGARLLGVSPLAGNEKYTRELPDNTQKIATNSSSFAHKKQQQQQEQTKVKKDDDEATGGGIKFSERVQVIEDDDSSSLLTGSGTTAAGLSSGSSNMQARRDDNNNDSNKQDSSQISRDAIPVFLPSILPGGELITAPQSPHQYKRLWAHEDDQEMDESSANVNALSEEQLALKDLSSFHVASQAGQARHRSPRHGAQFDLERYQPAYPRSASEQPAHLPQIQSTQPAQKEQQQQEQQQPVRLYSAEQLIREHMLKAMSKAADRSNSSAAPSGGATGRADEPNKQPVSSRPSGSVELPASEQVQTADDSSASHPAIIAKPVGGEQPGTYQTGNEQDRRDGEASSVGSGSNRMPSASAQQQKTYQSVQSAPTTQTNRYNNEPESQQQRQVNQLPVFADQEYNVPAHMAESVIHDLERAAPVSMFESQQQQQQQHLAKGQVPQISRFYQQQFSNLPTHVQRQIISQQQQQIAALQAAASQQHPLFLPSVGARWPLAQVTTSSGSRQAWPAVVQPIGRSSGSPSAASLLEAAKGGISSSRTNPTTALRHLFSSMRHRSGALSPAASPVPSSSSYLAGASPSSSSTVQQPPSQIMRSAKEDLMMGAQAIVQQQQQQVKLNGALPAIPQIGAAQQQQQLTVSSSSARSQDQEAQDSYGQMPSYHMMPEMHYNPPAQHEQYHYGGTGGGQHYTEHGEDDKKSKGITFHFGGGPIGGGTQLITSPMGIFKHLMIPLLPNPRVNLNGKVVFGVVLEKSTAFGEPKKKYKFWG